MLALKKIINAYEQGSPCTELVFPHQHPLPRNGLAGLPMPPLHILSQLLHEAKGTLYMSQSTALCSSELLSFGTRYHASIFLRYL